MFMQSGTQHAINEYLVLLGLELAPLKQSVLHSGSALDQGRISELKERSTRATPGSSRGTNRT